MVTTEHLRNMIGAYKNQIRDLSSEARQDVKELLRVFRKRLKRSQRKLVSLVREQNRLAGQGKKKASDK